MGVGVGWGGGGHTLPGHGLGFMGTGRADGGRADGGRRHWDRRHGCGFLGIERHWTAALVGTRNIWLVVRVARVRADGVVV